LCLLLRRGREGEERGHSYKGREGREGRGGEGPACKEMEGRGGAYF